MNNSIKLTIIKILKDTINKIENNECSLDDEDEYDKYPSKRKNRRDYDDEDYDDYDDDYKRSSRHSFQRSRY